MTPHLFVYGTLMSTARSALGADMRARLQLEARLAGAAAIQGRLYDLSAYPGLAASDDTTDIVHGEVYKLRDPAATLPWLDDYEDIGRRTGAGVEYERVAQPVRLASGTQLTAWVYRLRSAQPSAPRIHGGRWQAKD